MILVRKGIFEEHFALPWIHGGATLFKAKPADSYTESERLREKNIRQMEEASGVKKS